MGIVRYTIPIMEVELTSFQIIPLVNHLTEYLIATLVSEIVVLAITGTTGSSEQLLGEDDMRQLEKQRVHGFLQLSLQSGTFHPQPSPTASTVDFVGEMLGDKLFLRDLTTFVYSLLIAGNGFSDIPIVSLDGDVQPTTIMAAHSADDAFSRHLHQQFFFGGFFTFVICVLWIYFLSLWSEFDKSSRRNLRAMKLMRDRVVNKTYCEPLT